MHLLSTYFLHDDSLAELVDDPVPVDDARIDDIVQLEDDQTVGEVAVDVVDARRHAHAVHPVSVGWRS